MAWIQEIYDTLYDPNTICVACISHGKDSNAMLRAIKHLGLPLHRIVTTDVWATQDIPADLPEMWEWKKEADQTIKDLYGIEVEHICAMQKEHFPVSYEYKARVESHARSDLSQFIQVERERERECYESMFYRPKSGGRWIGNIKGFPCIKGSWCKKLKYEKIDIRRYILSEIQRKQEGRKRVRICNDTQSVLPRGAQEYTDSQCGAETGVQHISNHPYGFPISVNRGQWCQQLKRFSQSPKNEGQKINIIQYLGIAADESKRIAKHIGRPNIILPLVEIGWEEDLCGLISGYQNLLSPSYDNSTRDGCWFCHNQSVGQLRLLRKNHPDLWELLLKWDADSPVSFKPDGRTVHDFDERFALEDQGLISPDDPWKWGYIRDIPLQLKIKF